MRIASKGFIRSEVFFGVLILAAFAVFFIVLFKPFEKTAAARNMKRKSDLLKIQTALESYYSDHGVYPKSTSTYHIDDRVRGELEWGESWAPYLSVLPADPESPRLHYAYIAREGEKNYRLYASLEQGGNDASACVKTQICKDAPDDARCSCPAAPDGACGGVCNYGISSANVSP